MDSSCCNSHDSSGHCPDTADKFANSSGVNGEENSIAFKLQNL